MNYDTRGSDFAGKRRATTNSRGGFAKNHKFYSKPQALRARFSTVRASVRALVAPSERTPLT